MFEILRNRTFRRLFGAQVVALVGTGLATVALALLAYDLAGDQAGSVLGTALAIKMVVYVTLSPLVGAIVPAQSRKAVLIALDLVRAGVALMLPFVTEIWHIYVLIALLQSASAGFTPLFQAVIPDVLPDERDYTRALSLSRLAYDLENLLSPVLAAALLTVISFHGLFAGTSVGFVASALLVLAATFPVVRAAHAEGGPFTRALRGMRIYLRTPRLRGLLALNLVAAAGSAMVLVNTVVIVRGPLQGGEREVAWALAAFGGGSMVVALLLPKLLDRLRDRSIMLAAAALMTGTLFVATGLWTATQGMIGWTLLIVLWCLLGAAYGGLVTPAGRLLRSSAASDDLSFLFAAQFSLSHVCWLLTYPIAGWVGASVGLGSAFVALSGLAVLGLIVAWRVWPRHDPEMLEHSHPELPEDHPHVIQHQTPDGKHAHPYMIDEYHLRWPQ